MQDSGYGIDEDDGKALARGLVKCWIKWLDGKTFGPNGLADYGM